MLWCIKININELFWVIYYFQMLGRQISELFVNRYIEFHARTIMGKNPLNENQVKKKELSELFIFLA